MTHQTAFCVFRKGTIWLALPAKVVREVMSRPRLVRIPRSPHILSGMSHIRSEFLPVLNFSSLFTEERYGDERFLLIIEDADGDWGLLVDEVDSLVLLETSHASEEKRNLWESTVMGWASHDEHVIRILDHIRFRELASLELNPASHANESAFPETYSVDHSVNFTAPSLTAH